MEKPIAYVGLDVHKETISVAVAEGGLRWEVRYFGIIENRPAALRKLAERLGYEGRKLRFCYEAGPCGYGVYRQLTGLGHDCAVVAPSLIPRRPGDRVKTDRRDCLGLAKLDRAGELTAVWVPEPAHEAPITRLCAISCGPARHRSGRCVGRASSRPASCCATDACEPARIGPWRTGAGWRGSASSSRPSRSCWRTTSRPSRTPRPGASV